MSPVYGYSRHEDEDEEVSKEYLDYLRKNNLIEKPEKKPKTNSAGAIFWVGVVILPVTFIFLAISTDTLFDFAIYGILLDIIITPIALIVALGEDI